jgi:hypothetical protein
MSCQHPGSRQLACISADDAFYFSFKSYTEETLSRYSLTWSITNWVSAEVSHRPCPFVDLLWMSAPVCPSVTSKFPVDPSSLMKPTFTSSPNSAVKAALNDLKYFPYPQAPQYCTMTLAGRGPAPEGILVFGAGGAWKGAAPSSFLASGGQNMFPICLFSEGDEAMNPKIPRLAG